MKTVTFDEAQADFERMFQLAAHGETVVVQRHQQCVALRPYTPGTDPEMAPRGYFAGDYSPEEAAELNTLASQAPQIPLP